jgi:integrase
MPAKTELTWEPSTCRWKKVYKGKAYTISCRALGVPGTKVESYQAANEWWKVKKAEIDSYRPTHPHADRLELLTRRLDWAIAHGEIELAETLRGEMASYEADTDGELLRRPPTALGGLSAFVSPASNQLYESMNLPSPHAEMIVEATDDRVWNARLGRNGTSITNKERTVGDQVERYVSLERIRAESGLISIGEFDIVRRCLNTFRDWVGSRNSIDCLDADRWEAWWSHLVAQSISVEYKKKRFRTAKTFVAWLAEKGLIPLPLNLHSRRHRFGGGARSIPTIPIDEVRTLISAAPGQLKLHLLLMVNCGMTQVDIADLHPTEVDWKRGRIKRKRSKTREHENVPIVEYPLWPHTWKLLQKFGRHAGDRVLLTESGRPWLRDELREDGKRSKVDAIKSNYVHLQKKLDCDHPMKLFRKTSATLIESHPSYGRFKGQFLGHAPNTLAEKHYAAPSSELFDKIVTWLGKQYGLIVTEEQA